MKLYFRIWFQLNLRDRAYLLILLISRIALVALDLIGILLLGASVAIASGAGQSLGQFSSVFSFISGTTDAQNPYAFVALASLLFFVAKGLLAIYLNSRFAALVARVEHKKTVETFRSILDSNFDTLDRWGSKTLIYGLGAPSEMLFGRLLVALANVIIEIALIVGVSVFLLMIHPALFAVLGFFFAVVALTMHFAIGNRIQRISARVDSAGLRESIATHDALDSFAQIKVLKRQTKFVDVFSSNHLIVSKGTAQLSNLATLPRYILEIALMLALGILVAQRTLNPESGPDAGTVALFVAGAVRIAAALLPLQGSLGLLRHIRGMISLPLDMQEIHGDGVAPGSQVVPLNPDTLCAVEEVSYRYADRPEPAFQNVSLRIQKREILAIVGPSGGGKTTFAEVLVGLRKPHSGNIFFSDTDEVKVAYVPQKPNLINGTLLENILLGSTLDQTEERHFAEIIKMAQIHDLMLRLPQGLKTRVGGGGISLSGGEIQRVGIARALVAKPNFLVLDEITSALDSKTENQISATLKSLRGSCTIVVIAHRPSTIAIADRVFELQNGALRRI